MAQNKIRLLIITSSLPTRFNPLAAPWLVNQLRELKKYCEVKVLFPYPYVPKIKFLNPYYKFSTIKEKDKMEDIEIYRPKYFMFPRVLFVPRFLNFFLSVEAFISFFASKKTIDKIIKDWNPDIINIHGLFGEGLIGIWIKNKYHKPVLSTIHGEEMTKYAQKKISRILIKYALRNADAINSQSSFLKNIVINLDIKNKKFYLIPMGANIAKFKPRNVSSVRKLLGLPNDKKIILFVGHLIVRKSPEYLIKSIKHITKRRDDILCCLVGEGPMKNDLTKLISDLGVDRYVKLLGPKANKEVALYLNACDVLVLPSLNEGLPVILCEALACGKPVVASKVAAIPELINEDVGYLSMPRNDIDLADKISRALNKKWDVAKIIKRSKMVSAPNSAKKLVEAYKDIIKKNKNNTPK